MQRRRYLGAVAGAGACLGAGCLDRLHIGESPPERTVSLLGIVREPTEFNIELEATMTRSQVSADGPALLSVSMENTGAESVVIGFTTQNPGPLFTVTTNFERESGLILLPSEHSVTRRRGCWEPPQPYQFGGAGLGQTPVTLPPDETFTREYEVWGSHNAEGCLRPGRYYLGQQLNREGGVFAWLLSLRVEA